MQVPKNYKYNTEQIRRGTAALAETDYLMIKYTEAQIIIEQAETELTINNTLSDEDKKGLKEIIAQYYQVIADIRGKWLDLIDREKIRAKVRKAESDRDKGV